MTQAGIAGRARTAIGFFRAHPRLTKAIQALIVATTIALCAWAVVDQWHKAGPRLAHAKPVVGDARIVRYATFRCLT